MKLYYILFLLILVPFAFSDTGLQIGFTRNPSSSSNVVLTYFNYTTVSNMNSSNYTENWITSEGILQDVSDIQGSWITNDLGWISSYTEGDPVWLVDRSNYINQTHLTQELLAMNNLTLAEAEAAWARNYTAFNGSWSSSYNLTYATGTNLSWNETRGYVVYLNRSSEGLYLSTYNASYLTGESDLIALAAINNSINIQVLSNGSWITKAQIDNKLGQMNNLTIAQIVSSLGLANVTRSEVNSSIEIKLQNQNNLSMSQIISSLGLTNVTMAQILAGLGNYSQQAQYIANLTDINNSISIRVSDNATIFKTSGGTITGNLVVNGNFTVIGSTIEANITTQLMNGSFLPTVGDAFSIGNYSRRWQTVYANTLNGNLSCTNITGTTSNLCTLIDTDSWVSNASNYFTKAQIDSKFGQQNNVSIAQVHAIVANNNNVSLATIHEIVANNNNLSTAQVVGFINNSLNWSQDKPNYVNQTHLTQELQAQNNLSMINIVSSLGLPNVTIAQVHAIVANNNNVSLATVHEIVANNNNLSTAQVVGFINNSLNWSQDKPNYVNQTHLTQELLAMNNFSANDINNSIEIRVNSNNSIINQAHLTQELQAMNNFSANDINNSIEDKLDNMLNTSYNKSYEDNIGALNTSVTNLGTSNTSTNVRIDGINLTMLGGVGSGILWSDNLTARASLNVSCVGLDCTYPNFRVRLVTTTGTEKFCNISKGTTTVPDNQHTVYYVDNNCAVQSATISAYVATSVSPGGITDFFNVMTHSGSTEQVVGTSVLEKVEIKLRQLTMRTDHLRVIDGFNFVQEAIYKNFTIRSGNYQYVRDILQATTQNTSAGDVVEVLGHNSSTTYLFTDQYALNTTSCDNTTNITDCTSGLGVNAKWRRHFIFTMGHNGTTDNTEVHQLLPLLNTFYSTLSSCVNTETNPLTYTLPTEYQYTAVMLYAICAESTTTLWSQTGIIDMRARKSASATSTGSIDTSIFLTRDGATQLTNNWTAGNYNITADTFFGQWNGSVNYLSASLANVNPNISAMVNANTTFMSRVDTNVNANVSTMVNANTTFMSRVDTNVNANVSTMVNANISFSNWINQSVNVSISQAVNANSTFLALLGGTTNVNPNVSAMVNANSTFLSAMNTNTNANISAMVNANTTFMSRVDTNVNANVSTMVNANTTFMSRVDTNVNANVSTMVNANTTFMSRVDTNVNANVSTMVNANTTFLSILNINNFTIAQIASGLGMINNYTITQIASGLGMKINYTVTEIGTGLGMANITRFEINNSIDKKLQTLIWTNISGTGLNVSSVGQVSTSTNYTVNGPAGARAAMYYDAQGYLVIG